MRNLEEQELAVQGYDDGLDPENLQESYERLFANQKPVAPDSSNGEFIINIWILKEKKIDVEMDIKNITDFNCHYREMSFSEDFKLVKLRINACYYDAVEDYIISHHFIFDAWDLRSKK